MFIKTQDGSLLKIGELHNYSIVIENIMTNNNPPYVGLSCLVSVRRANEMIAVLGKYETEERAQMEIDSLCFAIECQRVLYQMS